MAPQRSDLVLATQGLYGEADVLVLHSLPLKTTVSMAVLRSPSFNLYRMVVFPKVYTPTTRTGISFSPKRPLEEVYKDIPHAVAPWEQQWTEEPSVAAVLVLLQLLKSRHWFCSMLSH